MKLLTFIGLLTGFSLQAQWSGFQSLHSPFGAKNAALGGRAISVNTGDVNQFVHNPALLDSVAPGATSVTYSPFFAGIYGFAGAHQANLGRFGPLAIALSWLNYGDFVETADNGDELGSFTATDYVLTVGKSHSVQSFTFGANVKYAFNGIAGYNASLLLADIGGVYQSPVSQFTAAILLKNMGFALSNFANVREPAPFDVQLGLTVKPEHMPFRFTFSAYNLSERDRYFRENLATGRLVRQADRVFRKLNVGAELVLHPNLQLLAGYSHLRRQELRLNDQANGAGWSFGFALVVKHIHIQYAHATYHAAGGTDWITLQSNLNAFKKLF